MYKSKFLATCAAVAISVATVGIASATTFTVGAGSSVNLTPTGAPWSGCTVGACVTESLATGLVGFTFDLIAAGDFETFNFLTFTGRGFGIYEEYDATATLAFSSPVTGASSGGDAGVYGVLGGTMASGYLEWDDVPVDVAFGKRGILTIDFEDGGIFLENSVTTTATVTLTRVDVVPLPAAGFLLLGGIGGLAAMRRWRKC